MKDLIIRVEEKKDWHEVEVLTRKAFWREERIEKLGVGATEHYMVHKMRGTSCIDKLTLVAEINNKIVGHIIYSNDSYIEREDGSRVEVLNFGPLSVLPEFQNKGIGKELMKHSISKAKDLGYGAIFIYGHPTYYPKFGFREALDYNITTKNGDNFPAFMGLELKEGYLLGVEGRFIEGEIFNESKTKDPAKEYDKKFQ